MIITSNVTEDYPVLDLPDARPLLNREVALTYPDRGYHRRIAAIAVPVAVLILKHRTNGVGRLSGII